MSCSLGLPGDPERTFGRAGTLADPRWTGLRPLSSDLVRRPRSRDAGRPRSITPDSRYGRRPSALPVLSGEIDYAGGFSAEDWRDEDFYKLLIGLGFVLKRTGMERGLPP